MLDGNSFPFSTEIALDASTELSFGEIPVGTKHQDCSNFVRYNSVSRNTFIPPQIAWQGDRDRVMAPLRLSKR
jgi:hypothetical protein